jgi:hypothetical protein
MTCDLISQLAITDAGGGRMPELGGWWWWGGGNRLKGKPLQPWLLLLLIAD